MKKSPLAANSLLPQRDSNQGGLIRLRRSLQTHRIEFPRNTQHALPQLKRKTRPARSHKAAGGRTIQSLQGLSSGTCHRTSKVYRPANLIGLSKFIVRQMSSDFQSSSSGKCHRTFKVCRPANVVGPSKFIVRQMSSDFQSLSSGKCHWTFKVHRPANVIGLSNLSSGKSHRNFKVYRPANVIGLSKFIVRQMSSDFPSGPPQSRKEP